MISSLSHFFRTPSTERKVPSDISIHKAPVVWLRGGVGQPFGPSNVLEPNTGSDLPSVVQYHAQQPKEVFFINFL